MYTMYINNTLPPELAVHEIYRDIFGPPMVKSIDILGPRLPTHTWRGRHMHRDYKRIEAASRYKFSQARGSN